MKRVDLAEFSDLLSFAKTIGYSWNGAHKILVDDEVPPMYETKSSTYSIEEVELDENGSNEYGWSADSIKIVTGFMKAENVTKFTLLG